MKAMKYTAYILGAVVLFASCGTMDRKSESAYEQETVFSDYVLARYAVNAIYETYVLTSAYRDDYLQVYGVNTDVDIWSSTSDGYKSDITRYKTLPTAQMVNGGKATDFYPGLFSGIERANLCIANLRKYGNVGNDAKMAALLGEALTARSLLYIDLMNVYGEVPARFEPVTNETQYLPKADRDVLYKHLLKDLKEAASLMRYEDQTRITQPGKACAQGLYARIALQAAGYSLRPDEGKVNTGDPGRIRKSTDPELQAEVLYPEALKALKEVIASGKFRLIDNYEELWKSYCHLETTPFKEVIFGMPFGQRGQHITHSGVPNEKYNFGTANRIALVTTLYFKYGEGDQRRDVTCCPCRYDSLGLVNTSNFKSTVMFCGKFRFDWLAKVHTFTKKADEDWAKFTYLRYADILLMASELENEMNHLDSAKEYMRPVLMRAYNGYARQQEAVDNYLASFSDTDAFRQAIKDQRALEFAGERLRRTDLIRWGCLQSSIEDAKADMTDFRANKGDYAVYNNNIFWKYVEKTGDPDYGTLYSKDIELKFIGPNDPEPTGWNKVTKYFSSMSTGIYSKIYEEGYDPDSHMYRPIPATVITANLGVLKNDYGY